MTTNRLPQDRPSEKPAINVAALCKGEERYIVVYGDDQRCQALKALRDWAYEESLSFDWADVATLRERIVHPEKYVTNILAQPKGDT